MGPFLSGFADELIKVAVAPPPPVTPPSTGVRGARAPRPSNAFRATNAYSQAIPTQRMESPAKRTTSTWRASPAVRSRRSAPVSETSTKARSSRRGPKKVRDQGVAFESGAGRVVRKAHEFLSGASMRASKGKPMFGKPPTSTATPKSKPAPYSPGPAKPPTPTGVSMAPRKTPKAQNLSFGGSTIAGPPKPPAVPKPAAQQIAQAPRKSAV